VYAHGKLLATVDEGDAVLILAGETHSVINGGETECTYIAVTVPPLDKTH
jgi:mannose-6-phosphate isomerase-like protein (cupin superfamily)